MSKKESRALGALVVLDVSVAWGVSMLITTSPAPSLYLLYDTRTGCCSAWCSNTCTKLADACPEIAACWSHHVFYNHPFSTSSPLFPSPTHPPPISLLVLFFLAPSPSMHLFLPRLLDLPCCLALLEIHLVFHCCYLLLVFVLTALELLIKLFNIPDLLPKW